MPDQIDKQTFSIEDGWTQRDKRQKTKILDRAFNESPLKLRRARQSIDALMDVRRNDAEVIGHLYFLAFLHISQAVKEAKIIDDDSVEKLEDLKDEFWETPRFDGNEYTPHDLKRMSEWANNHGRTPKKLRDLMKARGEKIHELISFAYAGTEAVKDGSGSDDIIDET